MTAQWEKRTAACEPRLSELVELYESLGYEVMLKPARLEDLGGQCDACYGPSVLVQYKTIYTRLRS